MSESRGRRQFMAALAAGSASALAGCGGSSESGDSTPAGTETSTEPGGANQGSGQGYRFFRGNVARSGNFPDRAGVNEGLSQSWQFESEDFFGNPVVANGVVYAVDGGGIAKAYSIQTQNELWESRVGSMGGGPIAVAGGTVYAPGRDGSLYALDTSTGTEQWRHDTGYSDVTAPAVADGTVYVTSSGSGGGKLVALEASSGNLEWANETDTPASGRPAVSDGMVYYYNTGVMAVNASGEQQWSVVDGGFKKYDVTTDGESVYFIKSGAESNPYVPRRVAEVVAVNSSDGSEQWRYSKDQTSYRGLAVDDGAVYTTRGSNVYKIDSESGDEEWSVSVNGRVNHAPVLYGDSIHLASGRDTFTVLNKADGSERFSIGDEFEVGNDEPVVADGTLYLTDANAVRAFE